jgi:Bacterial Ig-like domain (group 3)/IPT/TIG domain
MKLQSLILRNSLFFLTLTLALPAFRAAAQSKPDADQAQEKPSKLQQGLRQLPKNDAGLEAAQEGPDFLRRRQDWFFKPRAFPLGFIPQGARERALQQKKQMYDREGRLSLFAAPKETGFVAPPIGATSAWFPIGPQPTSTTLFDFSRNGGATSGRVASLVVNPNNANNVYLGGADGGLWVTTDGGTTWTPLTDNPANSGIPTIAVGSLAVDPASCIATICTTVYVGTGEDNFGADNVYGEGVLKCAVAAGTPPTATCTQDNTFHAVSPLSPFRGGPSIGALAVNRAAGKSNILLAGVRGVGGTSIPSGIWCSSDSGVTWSRVLPTSASASDPGTDVAFASDGTAWVALGNPFGDATNNGIYKSSAVVSSCTITFTKQTLPAALTTNIGRITLALSPSSDATLYTAIADSSTTSSNLLGVAKTTNATAATPAWTQLAGDTRLTTSGICNAQCFYDIPMAVSPASPNDVFLGGAANNGTLIRSVDGGSTWTEISQNDVQNATNTIHVDMHAIAFSANGATMFVGNDGGVWKTTTPTGTPGAAFWTNLNQNVQITQFYPGLSIHPSNTGFAMAGAQDNGIQDYQGFNGTPLLWQDSGLGCDGGFTVIDFNVPSTTYGECEYSPNVILLIATSFNNGDLINGFLATSGINGGDRGGFIPPFVIDPNNSNTLYFGTCLVYKTADNAQDWTAISPDVTNPAHPADCSNQSGSVLSTIAIAKGTSNTIYVGSDAGEVEVTSNGGTSWTSISANGGVLPGRAVTQIVVDPSNGTGDVAYVTFSGFASCTGCDAKGHVFKTTNGTAGALTAWTDISKAPFSVTPLPDIPVNALVIDPDDQTHNTLYVGTDIGAFFTSDGGLNWSPLGASNSLPNSQILSLTLHDPSRTLRAAMHGRGVWDINLGAGPNTPAFEISKLSPFTANAPGAATMLTVNGTGFTGTSVVMWGSTAKTTTFVSATQLTAPLTAGDLAAGAVVQVTVKDGANTTNSLPFTVIGQAPTITNSAPPSAPVNSAGTTITVTGTNFQSNSIVILNPDTDFVKIATTFVSSTQLTAIVPATFMANFGSTNSVGVQNPPPGGGATTSNSNPVALPTFKVIAPAPVNDNFANAINITPTNFTDTKDSSGATTQTSDPSLASFSTCVPTGTGQSNTIWYKVVPTGSGTANIDTMGSSYDTVLSVWSGTSQTALTAVACNDDINPGIIIVSQLQNLPLNAGTTYFIMVSSFGQGDPNPLAFGGKSILNFSFTGTIGGGTTGTFTLAGSAATATAGASGPSTITVTPSGGFTGNVAITCGTTLPGVGCSALSVNVPAGGGNGTGQLTINVTAPSSSMTAMNLTAPQGFHVAGLPPSPNAKYGWWTLSGGAGFAAIFLLLLPGRKRYRAAFGLGLVCVLSFALGCGGSGGGGGGGGLTATVTHLTVSSTKVAANGSLTVSATVTGGNPLGTVQFFLDGAGISPTSPLSGGTTGNITLTAATQLIGTHTLSAHYLGDASTMPSQSGTLNITVTGTANLPITGTSGSATASSNVSLTIN